MLRWANSSRCAQLALLLHHDDLQREFAYDRDFQISPRREGLDHANEYDFTLVSMKIGFVE